jgi:hypothetical protein
MMIRDVDRPLIPRSRGKDANPLRKAAEGLGVYLDRLSAAVRDERPKEGAGAYDDSVESGVAAQSRNTSRRFKLASPQDAPAEPLERNLNTEESEILEMLREARNLASDAQSSAVTPQERAVSQERMNALFQELSTKRAEILSSMMGAASQSGESPFSLMTPDAARTAYIGLDEMILRFLDVESAIGSAVPAPAAAVGGAAAAAAGTGDAGSPYIDHKAALSASEQLREFLINEGPQKAFSRFREINRSNVLGLLR